MTDEHRDEVRAILTRAAEQEAQRQAAIERNDAEARIAAEAELVRLWKAYGRLERDVA